MGKILFKLTPEIIDMIIFGMENQSNKYYVDIESGSVISETELSEKYNYKNVDSCLIEVPDWLPADGFQLMESFVVSLHNPIYKSTLRNVLSTKKGTFRNFKNIVKEHKFLEQQWYLHKEKLMRARVIEWYNSNNEIIKYTDIDENTDETKNLLSTDFIFNENCGKWGNLIKEKSDESIRESLGNADAIIAEYLISKNRSWMNIQNNFPIYVCAETVNNEFVGCISGGITKTGVTNSIIAVANMIWVEKKFRGMGIARELIDYFSKNAIHFKAERIIFELPRIDSLLNSTLEARGFSTFSSTMTVITENL